MHVKQERTRTVLVASGSESTHLLERSTHKMLLPGTEPAGQAPDVQEARAFSRRSGEYFSGILDKLHVVLLSFLHEVIHGLLRFEKLFLIQRVVLGLNDS